ncbi:LAMI_0E00100g1_1 [Lachancea mirantina]|uniref:LAMI_0E00100g1_1 n=1 Tax=Lachancea mirantina TaxID=1230905 RepID=A0A1G4JHV7_9SACH|nr:LAMI_0E00100g1_1 [Lachancea mirantina]
MVEPILGQAYGYCYILVLAAGFAALMIFITKILSKLLGEKQNSERFTTSGRNTSSGLIASAVVSSWTWPGTLLTSSGMAYSYGICGGAWYSFAFTIQITFFAVLALEIKRKAPGAHTILEIVKARFGKVAHWIMLFYALGTNVIISAMLLLGGCQAINVITGMHLVAAAMLLPIGVFVFTVMGGLKSTFISDWFHTIIIYLVIIISIFNTFTRSEKIGSIDRMYEMLVEVAETHPSAGYKGSYLTWTNKTALLNGWNIVIGGFSTVFCDPSYSQKAIAARPKSSMFGYFLGGLCWLVIPLALSLASSLANLALVNDPTSPTYPNLVPTTLVNEGIPMLYGLFMTLGKSGCAAGLLMIWLAATSATSAELIGFSSVVTYDVYRAYINPKASGKQLVNVTHICVTLFAIAMGGLTVLFNYIGITISWIISFIGVILGPGVFAFTLSLFWSRMTKFSIIIGPPLASIIALIGWCASAKSFYGAVNKDTLGEQYSCAVGNFIGLFGSLIFIIVISLLKPDKKPYDFETLDENFVAADDATVEEATAMKIKDPNEKRELKIYSFYSQIIAWSLFFILIFLIPMPMYGQNYIYSKKFFRGWVVIVMIWLLIAATIIILLPVYQSRNTLRKLWDISRGKQERIEKELLSAQPSHVIEGLEEVIEINVEVNSKEREA